MDSLYTFRSSRVHVETTLFYFFCVKSWYIWGPERLWRRFQLYVNWSAKWGIFNLCADRCLSFAVYFVWRASEWKSTLAMWLQLCNFDKMTTLKLFWLPDVVTLWLFSLKTQITLLMLDFWQIYLNFCQNVTPGPLLFLCIFLGSGVTLDFI